jgi:hypothetical protein
MKPWLVLEAVCDRSAKVEYELPDVFKSFKSKHASCNPMFFLNENKSQRNPNIRQAVPVSS